MVHLGLGKHTILNGFRYYAIPYTNLKPILKEDNLDKLKDRYRWSGHISDNILSIKNYKIDVAKYYNIDIPSHWRG